MHFSPEWCLRRRLAQRPGLRYVTTDLDPAQDVDLRLDVTAIDLPDGAFDAILCSHVLEHVPDDAAAMAELRRITAPGGFTLVMVPLALDRDATYEDPAVTAPADREREFLQHDHVRLYAPDIADRLRGAGFAVEVADMHAEAGPDGAARHGLLASDLIFLCRPGRMRPRATLDTAMAIDERRHSTRSRSNPGGMDVLKILGPDVRPLRERKPPWFKVPAPGGERYRELTKLIKDENLHTVCQEAACPNVGECWERGTATFMILGDTCTRRCGFCNVRTGKPTWNDPLEPARVARSIAKMGLRHAVITSVDRDDLPDYGASAFVGVIRQIRRQAPRCKVEVLTPDFRGQEMPLAKVIAERPDVFNHNVEVVPRLYPVARRGSRFERSCRVLRNAKEMGGDAVTTKSGLMVGLGETHEEMVEAFGILREHGVQVLTVGQYLRPTERHLPGRALLAPGRVQGARGGGLRARLRPHRGRPARALQLPRRPAHPTAGAGQRAARGSCPLTPHTLGITILTVRKRGDRRCRRTSGCTCSRAPTRSTPRGSCSITRRSTIAPSSSCPGRTPSSCSARASRRWPFRR